MRPSFSIPELRYFREWIFPSCKPPLVQITGVLLAFFLIFGYLFAANWPGRKWLIPKLRIARLFQSFEVFYVTHAIMGIALLVLLILHPRPASNSNESKGLTWAYLAAGSSICIMERLARAIK